MYQGACTLLHTHTLTHMHAPCYTLTHSHTCIHPANTQHTHTYACTLLHTHTLTHMHAPCYTLTHSHTCMYPATHSHTHTYACTLLHSHSHSHSHACMHALTSVSALVSLLGCTSCDTAQFAVLPTALWRPQRTPARHAASVWLHTLCEVSVHAGYTPRVHPGTHIVCVHAPWYTHCVR